MAMADKKKVLLDSIAKLKKLKVSDDEIVLYLKEFGVSESDVRALLRGENISIKESALRPAEGKTVLEEDFAPPIVGDLEIALSKIRPKSAMRQKDYTKEFDFSLDSQELEMPDRKGSAELDLKVRHSKHSEKHASGSKPLFEKSLEEETGLKSSKPVNPMDPAKELSGLWEKGIINTVTDSLIEIKQMRDELDAVLEKRIGKAMEKESAKLSALSENMRTLMMAKMNADLEKKSKELVSIMDAKIAELKKERELLVSQVEVLKTEKRIASDMFKELSSETVRTREMREKSLAQFNVDLAKAKTAMFELTEESRKKLLALEERATKTLQLETAIIEGMVQDAGNRMDRLAVEKFEELSAEVQKRISEFDELKEKSKGEISQLEFEELRMRLQSLESHAKKK